MPKCIYCGEWITDTYWKKIQLHASIVGDNHLHNECAERLAVALGFVRRNIIKLPGYAVHTAKGE